MLRKLRLLLGDDHPGVCFPTCDLSVGPNAVRLPTFDLCPPRPAADTTALFAGPATARALW